MQTSRLPHPARGLPTTPLRQLDTSSDPDSLLGNLASIPCPTSAHARTTSLPSFSRLALRHDRSRSWINSIFKSPRSTPPLPSPTLPNRPDAFPRLRGRSGSGTLSGGEMVQVKVGSWAGKGPLSSTTAARRLQVSGASPLPPSPSSASSDDSLASPISLVPNAPRTDSRNMDLAHWDRELAEVRASLKEEPSSPAKRKRSSSHLSVGIGGRRSVSDPLPLTSIQREDSLLSLGTVWNSFLEEADLTFDEILSVPLPPSPSTPRTSPNHSSPCPQLSPPLLSPFLSLLSTLPTTNGSFASTGFEWDTAVTRSTSAISLADFPSPPLPLSNFSNVDTTTPRPFPRASIAERRARVVPALVIQPPLLCHDESGFLTATSSTSILSYVSTSSGGAGGHSHFSPISPDENSPPRPWSPATRKPSPTPSYPPPCIPFTTSSRPLTTFSPSPPLSSTFSDASFQAFSPYPGSLDTDASWDEEDDERIWGDELGTWEPRFGCEDEEDDEADLTIRIEVERWRESKEVGERVFEEQGVIEYGSAL